MENEGEGKFLCSIIIWFVILGIENVKRNNTYHITYMIQKQADKIVKCK